MRKNDKQDQSHRRDGRRVYRVGAVWFYHTREGARGPFESEVALRADLQAYVGTMEYIEENAAALPGELDCSDVTLVDIEPPQFCAGGALEGAEELDPGHVVRSTR